MPKAPWRLIRFQWRVSALRGPTRSSASSDGAGGRVRSASQPLFCRGVDALLGIGHFRSINPLLRCCAFTQKWQLGVCKDQDAPLGLAGPAEMIGLGELSGDPGGGWNPLKQGGVCGAAGLWVGQGKRYGRKAERRARWCVRALFQFRDKTTAWDDRCPSDWGAFHFLSAHERKPHRDARSHNVLAALTSTMRGIQAEAACAGTPSPGPG